MAALEIANITSSIENKQLLVLYSHARSGEFQRDARNRLIKYAGGYAVLYPYIVNNEKWGFRCWHKNLEGIQRKLEIVSNAIQNAQLSFLCDFTYVEKGIVVDKDVYPIIRMQWIEGLSIKDYLYNNRNDSNLIKELSEKFLSLVCEMHKHLFAHGDLQHGNIRVGNYGNLYLIDYDSFYCKELNGEPDVIVGLPDYQHPSRATNKKVSEKLDYFSELIIYLSLVAISLSPDLAEKYRVNDADRLLFETKDYEDLKNSNIYIDLKNLNDSKIDNLLKILEDYLSKSSVDDLTPFGELLNQMELSFEINKCVIRKGNETAVVSWNAKDANSAVLKDSNDNIISEGIAGSIEVHPDQTTNYNLYVVLKDGSSISKTLTLKVSEGAVVNFSSDKLYVFPGIPFTLKWDVKNANTYKLNGVAVASSGSLDVTEGIEKDTTYVFEVEDDFGVLSQLLKISILPLPVVKMNVNPPIFNSSIVLQHGISSANMAFCKTPELPNLQIKAPFVETAKLNMELPHFIEFRLPEISLWERLKCSFNNAYVKVKNNIKNK